MPKQIKKTAAKKTAKAKKTASRTAKRGGDGEYYIWRMRSGAVRIIDAAAAHEVNQKITEWTADGEFQRGDVVMVVVNDRPSELPGTFMKLTEQYVVG